MELFHSNLLSINEDPREAPVRGPIRNKSLVKTRQLTKEKNQWRKLKNNYTNRLTMRALGKESNDQLRTRTESEKWSAS